MIELFSGGLRRLFVPKQAVGANLIYFDLFNATGSNAILEIWAVLPIVSGAVAVTGVVGVDLFLQRTTAVGTGGTAATLEGTDPTACTISAYDKAQSNLNSLITARITPSGGATAGAVIAQSCVFTEETNSGSYMGFLNEMVRRGMADAPPIKVRENTGISVVQGSVASVGNIGFDVLFQMKAK